MAFEARIGVGDTIVAATPVRGLRNVALYLETADGDLGEVVAEWRGDDVARAFAEGTLVEGSLHATAYLRARALGAFDRREQAFLQAVVGLEGRVLGAMGADLASRHRPWQEDEDASFVSEAAVAAASALVHMEGGPLAHAPRGIRFDAREHLAEVGIAVEAAWRAGPSGHQAVIDGREAVLKATARGEVEIRMGDLNLLASPEGVLRTEVEGTAAPSAGPVADAVRSYLERAPADSAVAAYCAMVGRSREIGRTAAELEARAEVLFEERDGLALHLAGVLGVADPVADPPVHELDADDLGPAPRF